VCIVQTEDIAAKFGVGVDQVAALATSMGAGAFLSLFTVALACVPNNACCFGYLLRYIRVSLLPPRFRSSVVMRACVLGTPARCLPPMWPVIARPNTTQCACLCCPVWFVLAGASGAAIQGFDTNLLGRLQQLSQAEAAKLLGASPA
jgi:hypothetical protein